MTTQQVETINGVAPSEVQELVTAISQDATQAQLSFKQLQLGLMV